MVFFGVSMNKWTVNRAWSLVALGLGLLSQATAQAQSWERLVAPGLTYRMEVDLGLPRVIHALRYTPGVGNISSRPELAGGAVFVPDDATKGREAVTATMARTEALAGINADFFPWTGDPLGAMVRNGEIISTPYKGRSVFAWGNKYSFSGVVDARGFFTDGITRINLQGVNEECLTNSAVLFTSAAGMAVAKEASLHAILEPAGPLQMGRKVMAKIRELVPGVNRVAVEQGTMVLTAHGDQAALLSQIGRGGNVEFQIDFTGLDVAKTTHVIAGGPLLVSNGKLNVNNVAEKFSADFTTKRHPRTAIGATKEGDIWLVVIDGRQLMSRGATLEEVGLIMQRLGCVHAINLDGGGSSTLALTGMVVNRPSDGTERPVSNGVFLFGELPAQPVDANLVIKGVPRLNQGESATYAVINSRGERLPQRDVIWSAQGAAWIDQAGVLRAHANGKATISAWISGVKVSVEVTVDAVAPTPPANSGGGRN